MKHLILNNYFREKTWMKKIESMKVEENHETEEPYNLFDDFSFWLQLAYMDFAFEMTEAEK